MITRGATLLWGYPHALRNTNIFLTTDACLTSQNTQERTPFDCALSGPFDDLRSAGFSAPRLSVSARIAVIPASTVYWL